MNLKKIGFLAKDTSYIVDAYALALNILNHNEEAIIKNYRRVNGFEITTDKSIYKFAIANECSRGHRWNEVYIYNKDEISDEMLNIVVYPKIMPFDFNDKSWRINEHIKYIKRRDDNMKIRIKYFEGATKLQKIAKGNWIDIYANKDVFVDEGDRAMIPLGFALELPQGYEGHLAPRSSTFKTWGIIQTNSVGIVDDTYIGDNDQWHMPVFCLQGKEIETDYGIITKLKEIDEEIKGFDINGEIIYRGTCKPSIIKKGTWIRKGDKIGQFRIMEVMPTLEFEEVEYFGNQDREGFGSTGAR